jgi:hypothetical protein
MPEFILNEPATPHELRQARAYGSKRKARSHVYFELNEFAKGYVEALFFTNGDIGDDKRENRLNEMGVGRLTKKAVAAIAADCQRFETENREMLDSALALDGLKWRRGRFTDQRLGNLFWFARQGHGVSFTDDDSADCLSELQNAARAFGESYVECAQGWIHVR